MLGGGTFCWCGAVNIQQGCTLLILSFSIPGTHYHFLRKFSGFFDACAVYGRQRASSFERSLFRVVKTNKFAYTTLFMVHSSH